MNAVTHGQSKYENRAGVKTKQKGEKKNPTLVVSAKAGMWTNVNVKHEKYRHSYIKKMYSIMYYWSNRQGNKTETTAAAKQQTVWQRFCRFIIKEKRIKTHLNTI